MAAQDELRQAIQLMQDGQVETAAGMLNRLVSNSLLDAIGRAAAYVWLAESRNDRDFKVRCLQQALECEPDNVQIRQGLNQLLATPDQPEQLPAMRHERESVELLEQAPVVVGIDGGVNGLASAVFISQDGLLATTSYAIGSVERVAVHVPGESEMSGAVVRRFPQYDLAFVSTPLKLTRKPSVAPPAFMAEDAAFVAYFAGGGRLRGVLTRADRGLPTHWLPTNIPPVQLMDASGNPLYDEHGQLIGILTRNTDHSGYAFGIRVSHILALAEAYRRDRQLMPNAGYCRTCGALTRAQHYGGSTCESCGAALSGAAGSASASLQSDKLMQLYGEDKSQPCPHCSARVGNYERRCLRCGLSLAAAGG